jgi:hypothetical protein
VKFLNKILTIFVIGTVFSASGCGSAPSLPHAKTNVTATANTLAPTPSKQTIWIEYARYTASQAHENPTYWVLTNKPVNHVGELLGTIDDPSTESGWHSNKLSVRTKFFTIPGTSWTKAFAVQMKDGMYLEAVLAGSKKPNGSTQSTSTSITVADMQIGKVKIDESFAQLQKDYGIPNVKTTVHGNGNPQWIYTQHGLTVNGPNIWMIWVKKGFDGSTTRGIHIGSTTQEVEKVYPTYKWTLKNSDLYVDSSDHNYEIDFRFLHGEVNSIQLTKEDI